MKRALLIVFILPAIFCKAQSLAHFNITQAEGLPSNTVYDIFQDSQGFLWVATENGLARYNGASFRPYNNTEVRAAAVSGLCEDTGGRIWLHNFFGEILYIEKDTLHKLRSWDDRYSTGFPAITTFGDTLLISSSTQLYKYSPSDQKWLTAAIPALVPATYNHHLSLHGIQWICYTTETNVYVKMIGPESAPQYVFDKKEYRLNDNVTRLTRWKEKLWMFDATADVLIQLDSGTTKNITAEYGHALQQCRQIQNIGDSLLAFTGPDGVFLLNKSNQWLHLLPEKNASCVTADREGGIWVGTLNEGIFYFPSTESTLYPKEQFGLYTKLAIDRKARRILAGNYSGSADLFSFDGLRIATIHATDGKEVQAAFTDTVSNQYFIFTNALRVYDAITRRPVAIHKVASVKQIVRAGDNIAMATSAGLYFFDPIRSIQKHYFDLQRMTSLAVNSSGTSMYVGTQKGLFTLDLTSGIPLRWPADTTQVSPGASVLRTLSNGNIAAGTFTNGLYLIAPSGPTIHLTTNDGLPSNRITSLTEGKEGLWIGTDNGVALLQQPHHTVSIINRTKGLLAQEVYDLVIVEDQLWVSHAAGLQSFRSIRRKNLERPRIHLVSASTAGEVLRDIGSGITLLPSSQQLSLTFDVSNNLKGQGTTRIFYRIRELHGDRWQVTTLREPRAYFLSLPYGHFTFEAKAENEDGVVSVNTLTIPLAVLAPFWKQTWFTIVVFVVSLAVIGWLVYLRVKRMSVEKQLHLQRLNQQQELRIAQLTSIRAQMNPHFIFNTMALIQGKMLSGHTEEANRSIQHFSTLVRKVLDFSSREMITLDEEIEVLERYLTIENDRLDSTLEFNITSNDEARGEMIRIPSLLTQPYVENALRHGLMHKEGEKRLTIDFTLLGSVLTITIDDNGIGRQASAEWNKRRNNHHHSFALSASQKRIDLLNTSRNIKIRIDIIDKVNAAGHAEGTTVKIVIPIDNGIE